MSTEIEAALAGIPRPIVDRARARLRHLEAGQVSREDVHRQLDLFPPREDHPVVEALSALDPDELSPRSAMETLYRLKAMLAPESSN